MEIFIVRTLAPLGMACNDRPVRIFSSKFRMRRSTWEGWSVPLLFVRADTRPSQQIFTDKRNLVLWYKYGKQDQSDKTDWHVLVGPATYHPSLGLITNWRWSFISRTRWFLFYKLPFNGVWFDYKHSHPSFSFFSSPRVLHNIKFIAILPEWCLSILGYRRSTHSPHLIIDH